MLKYFKSTSNSFAEKQKIIKQSANIHQFCNMFLPENPSLARRLIDFFSSRDVSVKPTLITERRNEG